MVSLAVAAISHSAEMLAAVLCYVEADLLTAVRAELAVAVPALLSVTRRGLLLARPLRRSLGLLLPLGLLLSDLKIRLRLHIAVVVIVHIDRVAGFRVLPYRSFAAPNMDFTASSRTVGLSRFGTR